MICNFMIFSESVGSGACLSARLIKKKSRRIYSMGLFFMIIDLNCLEKGINVKSHNFLWG